MPLLFFFVYSLAHIFLAVFALALSYSSLPSWLPVQAAKFPSPNFCCRFYCLSCFFFPSAPAALARQIPWRLKSSISFWIQLLSEHCSAATAAATTATKWQIKLNKSSNHEAADTLESAQHRRAGTVKTCVAESCTKRGQCMWRYIAILQIQLIVILRYSFFPVQHTL